MENKRRDTRIHGNNNVVGDNNNINSHQENHHHNHNHNNSSNGGKTKIDIVPIVAVLLTVTATVCWLFVRHADEIYFYIKLGALTSAVLFVFLIMFWVFRNAPDLKQLVSTIIGFVLAGMVFILALHGQEQLGVRIVQHGQQVPNAWDFWKGLTDYGHQIVIGNLMAAVSLAIVAFLNLFMGVFVLWHYMIDVELEDSLVLRKLNAFRPGRGGVFSVFLLAVSWVSMKGWALEFIKSIQS